MAGRPKNAPSRIPQWAWLLNKWYATKPRLRGPRPGPTTLPAWFWPWRVWVRSRRPTPITMYDSTTPLAIPPDAAAVAGYVNGFWPTYPQLMLRFPNAHKLSVAVTAHANADCLDIEKGDAEPAQAAAWVKRQINLGVKRPVVYTSLSQADALIAMLLAGGVPRTAYRLWTAHCTGVAHRCSTSCGYGFVDVADATQYDDRALGRNLDVSLCAPGFFA